jgi:hypothetical protein
MLAQPLTINEALIVPRNVGISHKRGLKPFSCRLRRRGERELYGDTPDYLSPGQGARQGTSSPAPLKSAPTWVSPVPERVCLTVLLQIEKG